VAAGGLVRRLQQPPWLGLLAFAVTFTWKPTAHAISVLSHGLLHGAALGAAYTTFGLLGFALVWLGFRRDELTASFLGFFGGALIFMFWIEPSFALFAERMGLEPLRHHGQVYLSPNLVLMESSAVVFLVVLVLLGANKDTRCRMFMWFHRNFRLRPNRPTPGYRRQYSRIAAMETIFVSWFFYIVIIGAVDPRLLGPAHPLTRLLTAAMFAWGVYLVGFKLPGLQAMGEAFRYAIAVAGVLWFCVEMTSLWGWYTEFWLQPLEHPLPNLGLFAACLLCLVFANATGRRGATAAD